MTSRPSILAPVMDTEPYSRTAASTNKPHFCVVVQIAYGFVCTPITLNLAGIGLKQIMDCIDLEALGYTLDDSKELSLGPRGKLLAYFDVSWDTRPFLDLTC